MLLGCEQRWARIALQSAHGPEERRIVRAGVQLWAHTPIATRQTDEVVVRIEIIESQRVVLKHSAQVWKGEWVLSGSCRCAVPMTTAISMQ